MTKSRGRSLTPIAIALAASAVMLSGCTTRAYVSPVEVTRFTGSAPAELGHGTISLQPAPGLDTASLEYDLYEAEVAEELASLGYTIVSNDGSQVAEIGVEHSLTQPDRRGPVSVGAGMGAGSYGSGVGLGIGIDLSGPPPEEIGTHLSVSIRPAQGGDNLWEGRAHFTATANSDLANPALAADYAASALFTGFPGNSGETIEVE